MDQLGLAAFGIAAIFLSQDSRESWRRWACIFGLAGQPFWLWSSWHAGQWGVFLLCFIYAGVWARGVWTYWLRRQDVKD